LIARRRRPTPADLLLWRWAAWSGHDRLVGGRIGARRTRGWLDAGRLAARRPLAAL